MSELSPRGNEGDRSVIKVSGFLKRGCMVSVSLWRNQDMPIWGEGGLKVEIQGYPVLLYLTVISDHGHFNNFSVRFTETLEL